MKGDIVLCHLANIWNAIWCHLLTSNQNYGQIHVCARCCCGYLFKLGVGKALQVKGQSRSAPPTEGALIIKQHIILCNVVLLPCCIVRAPHRFGRVLCVLCCAFLGPQLFTVAQQPLQCQLILSHRRARSKSGRGKHCSLRSTTMAAEIHSRPQTARPVLLNKIEGHSDAVTGAVLIPKEDGVITVSEDRWAPRAS